MPVPAPAPAAAPGVQLDRLEPPLGPPQGGGTAPFCFLRPRPRTAAWQRLRLPLPPIHGATTTEPCTRPSTAPAPPGEAAGREPYCACASQLCMHRAMMKVPPTPVQPGHSGSVRPVGQGQIGVRGQRGLEQRKDRARGERAGEGKWAAGMQRKREGLEPLTDACCRVRAGPGCGQGSAPQKCPLCPVLIPTQEPGWFLPPTCLLSPEHLATLAL